MNKSVTNYVHGHLGNDGGAMDLTHDCENSCKFCGKQMMSFVHKEADCAFVLHHSCYCHNEIEECRVCSLILKYVRIYSLYPVCLDSTCGSLSYPLTLEHQRVCAFRKETPVWLSSSGCSRAISVNNKYIIM